MIKPVNLAEKLGSYEVSKHLDSGWGWSLYRAHFRELEEPDGHACHVRVFSNQPKNGHLHTHLIEVQRILREHPHLHVQAIRKVQHVELQDGISAILVEEELLKKWKSPKPSDYIAVTRQLLSAVQHLHKLSMPGVAFSKSNLARTPSGKAVLANLSPNWEQSWAGQSRAGDAGYYFNLPPESAESPTEFGPPQWVWSAGGLLAEALGGMTVPDRFLGEADVFNTPVSSYVNHGSVDFRGSQLSELPENFQKILGRALAANPEDRFGSLSSLCKAFDAPIRTAKPGDRYIIPTSTAVQEISLPPRNTFWGYAFGFLMFLLTIPLIVLFVTKNPLNLGEPKLAIQKAGPSLEQIRHANSEGKLANHKARPDVDLVTPLSAGSPDIQMAALAFGDGFLSVQDRPAPLQEDNSTSLSSQPEATIAGFDSSESLAAYLDLDGSVSPDWMDLSGFLSRRSWDAWSSDEQDQILTAVPIWVAQQRELMDEAENLHSRSFRLEQFKTFWGEGPERLQQMPEVLELVKEINMRRLIFRIRIANQTSREVSILDPDGNSAASLEKGASIVLEVPAGEEPVLIRAQDGTAWTYSDKPFKPIPGGFVEWDVTELTVHNVHLIPEPANPEDEIQIYYSKRDLGETLPVEGEMQIPPGDYRFTFIRPDYYPVSKVLRFSKPNRRYHVRLPSPDNWVPKPNLDQFLSWEQRWSAEPDRVISEIGAEDSVQLEGKAHQRRLEQLQEEIYDYLGTHKVEVKFSDPDKLVPPARVDVRDPAGKVTPWNAAQAELVPGKYQLIFHRHDYQPIEMDWHILPESEAIQIEFPGEGDWIPNPTLAKLHELEHVMLGSGEGQPVQLIRELLNKSFEWPEHKNQYRELRKSWYRQVVGL